LRGAGYVGGYWLRIAAAAATLFTLWRLRRWRRALFIASSHAADVYVIVASWL